MIQRLFNIYKWFINFFVKEGIYKSVHVEDLPKVFEARRVYILGPPGQYWMAALICPCGCNQKLHMNLLKSQKPCWKVKIGDKKEVSFYPSLWKKTGCKSHFFLKNGCVDWVTSRVNY